MSCPGEHGSRSIAPVAQTAGFFDQVNLDIDVKTAEQVAVDNNYARIDMGANLRLVGTLQNPVPTGRLTIEEGGDVFLGGRTYDIVRGTVDFTSATRMEPTVDLALQTRVQRYDITLEVSGTPETLKATLRSPGVSQAELVSLLLTLVLLAGARTVSADMDKLQRRLRGSSSKEPASTPVVAAENA